MYRNVMVPVDGSSFSREAVVQGLRIASQSGATLRLVRIGTSSLLASAPDGLALASESLREIHAAELADLYAIAAECRAHSTVNVTASLQQGPIVDSLMGYAKRYRVDLVVMRSHARKGLARAWFGSIADALIRESGIPVLVVRPPSVATALEDGFHFKRILVPLDGSALAEQSLGPAVSLARIDGARITLLRVVTPSKVRRGAELESSLGPAPASEVTEAQDYLNSLLAGSMDGTIEVTRRVVIATDIAGTILETADGFEADLIAIATRGRGAFARATAGSVSDRVMREAPVSAMIIHPAPRVEASAAPFTNVAAAQA